MVSLCLALILVGLYDRQTLGGKAISVLVWLFISYKWWPSGEKATMHSRRPSSSPANVKKEVTAERAYLLNVDEK